MPSFVFTRLHLALSQDSGFHHLIFLPRTVSTIKLIVISSNRASYRRNPSLDRSQPTSIRVIILAVLLKLMGFSNSINFGVGQKLMGVNFFLSEEEEIWMGKSAC